MDSHRALRDNVENGRHEHEFPELWEVGTAGPRGRSRGDSSKGDDRLTFNEPRDVLPDEGDTLAVRVCPDGADLALELSGASDDIFGERISCQLSESWPLHQRRHLLQRNRFFFFRIIRDIGGRKKASASSKRQIMRPLTWRLNVIGG